MQAIDGLAFGSSKAQGVVRDNRFYHADMGITMAFPRGWIIENHRDRILGFTQNQESVHADHGRPRSPTGSRRASSSSTGSRARRSRAESP